MAYSRVVVEGDGTTTQFAVNFALDYLREADVTCRVGDESDGTGHPVYRDLTFLTTNLVQVGGATVADGVQIVFERTVDKDDLLVNFSNGDALDEDNLTVMQKQVMMAVHEVLDGRTPLIDTLTAIAEEIQDDADAVQDAVDTIAASTATATAAATAAAASAADAAMGIPGVSFIGDWDDTTEFAFTEAVLHDGSTYVALVDNTGVEPGTSPTTWQLLAARGNAGSGSQLDIRDFGAVPRTSDADTTTDATAAIQAAMDTAIGLTAVLSRSVEVLIPDAEFGWGITQLIFRAENLHLVGVGGPNNYKSGLHYIGTGASATAMIYADYEVHRGGENYRGCGIRNLHIDGMNNALHCFKANGWTRYCEVRNTVFTRAVNPLNITNGYYSRWVDVEVVTTPRDRPVGMDPTVHSNNLYGAFFDICHIMRLESFKLHDIGSALSYKYTAAMCIRASEAVTLSSPTLEGCRQVNDRYVKIGWLVGAGTTLTIDSSYVEDCDFETALLDVSSDNQMLTLQGVNYWNNIKPTIAIRCMEMTPIAINGTLFCENLSIPDSFMRPNTGITTSRCKNVTINGNVTLFSGPATAGSYYNAAAGVSPNGVATYPITSQLPDGTSVGTGTIITGYVPSIVGNYITVTPGRAIINGIPVSNMRHSGLRQRLYPELDFTGNWNVRINSLGCPYIEKQVGTFPGSDLYKRIATFATTGGTNNPSSLTLT